MNGILVVNKPKGWTSHDVVNKVRGILREKRIGHTGTLDPIATGVLVLCIGKATKLVRYLEGDDKEYIAELSLGTTTDTLDADGTVLERREYFPPSVEQVQEVMGSFHGNIRQVPPAFSALKVNGIPSYRLARRGSMIEHATRMVSITAIRLLRYADPVVRFSVSCSKGTYVRTLCNDIGDRLGMGAHLISLVRTRAGRFPLDKALQLETIAELASSDRLEEAVMPFSEAVNAFPLMILDEDDSRRIAHGNAVALKDGSVLLTQLGPVQIMSWNGRFLALARVRDGRLEPEVVLA